MLSFLKVRLGEFVQQEDGPTAVEYAIMMALIIVVCFAATLTLGTKTNTTYQTVGSQLGKTAGS
jgi:pilus assembly protein Flp/PilA